MEMTAYRPGQHLLKHHPLQPPGTSPPPHHPSSIATGLIVLCGGHYPFAPRPRNYVMSWDLALEK